MTVRHILEAKGRDVATTEPQTSIGEAASLLCERKIGALVVVGEGAKVLGILSERDIVRLVVGEGAEGLSKPVSDRMTANVVVGHEAMTLDEAMGLMTKGRFRHLPICESGRLVGIISIGDAVKRRLEEVEEEAENMRSYIHAG